MTDAFDTVAYLEQLVFQLQLEALHLRGVTDVQLATMVDVSIPIVRRWRKRTLSPGLSVVRVLIALFETELNVLRAKDL